MQGSVILSKERSRERQLEAEKKEYRERKKQAAERLKRRQVGHADIADFSVSHERLLRRVATRGGAPLIFFCIFKRLTIWTSRALVQCHQQAAGDARGLAECCQADVDGSRERSDHHFRRFHAHVSQVFSHLVAQLSQKNFLDLLKTSGKGDVAPKASDF